MTILRCPEELAEKKHDVIIVGGGIYGVMLAYEASRRGISSLLLEKEDFGGATSYNSLRTIHGGFRYLQTLNLILYFRFVRERRWFLENFPEFTEPLPVLMPLYGRGIRRPAVLRLALAVDRLLSRNRNEGLPESSHLPFGYLMNRGQVEETFRDVRPQGLKGGAVWYDAAVPDSQRLLIEILHQGCGRGARALNYMNVEEAVTENGTIHGVVARDCIRGRRFNFQADTVLNVTGPWSRRTAAAFDSDYPRLFKSSIAWNVLFDREALSSSALAVTPDGNQGQTYFIHPWKNRLLVGTGHAPRADVSEDPQPQTEEIREFIDRVNQAIPALNLRENEMLHVYCGYLPVTRQGGIRLSKKEVIIDHSRHNGPKGLYSISGVKFTAARYVAEKIIRKLFPRQEGNEARRSGHREERNQSGSKTTMFDYDWYPEPGDSGWEHELQEIIRKESVHHLDDLVLRRTSLGDNPVRALEIAPKLCDLFPWEEERQEEELRRLRDHFKHRVSM